MPDEKPKKPKRLDPRGRYQGVITRVDWLPRWDSNQSPVLILRIKIDFKAVIYVDPTIPKVWVPYDPEFHDVWVFLDGKAASSGSTLRTLRYVGWVGDDPFTIPRDVTGKRVNCSCVHAVDKKRGEKVSRWILPTQYVDFTHPKVPDTRAVEVGHAMVRALLGGGE